MRALGHHFGGSGRHFGAILGVRVGSGSQMRLGRSLGPSWRRLGGVLKASWAVLGRKRWPTSPQVGSQNGAKIDKKSIQKSINFLMPLGIVILRFSLICGAKNQVLNAENHYKTNTILIKSEVSGVEKSNKNRSKNEAKMGIALGIGFSWILIDFWRQV